VRGDDDVVDLGEGPRVRLSVENVEGGGGHIARLERIQERRFVEQLAAGCVDESDAVAHLREGAGVDRAPRLGGQRQMQRQEVGRGEHVVLGFEPPDTELPEPLFGDQRIVGDHTPPQPGPPPGDLLAGSAEA